MTEVEYVIAIFAERFAGFRDKRIVLHGSRNYAEAIIDKFADTFNFIGVMSLDSIVNESFHGLKVLHEEDIPTLNFDLIILTERVKYEIEAFRSIRHVCRKKCISVFNMYGLNEFSVYREAINAEYLTLETAKKLCEPYDIVAFEVMDTLLPSSLVASDIIPRKLLYDLILWLRKRGKEIKYSLRKSCPSDIQIEILKKFGLLLNENNELIFRTGEDLSFRQLQEKNYGKKILYFGSGLANEFILPRYYGIHTYRFVNIHNFDCLVPGKREIKKIYSGLTDLKKNIENRILEKEWISFDVFDTLLMRKTLFPKDVFCLIEQRALLAGYDIKGFASARIRAEEEQPFCNIVQIYAWLQEYFEWDNAVTHAIQELEIATEKEVLAPRTEVIELLNFAKKSGKRIVLTSDMYFPENTLCNILLEKGISGYEKLLVSCDLKKTKHTGLYDELIHLCGEPGKLLHIGDNPVADGIDSKNFGIESILIPSALELAKTRGWENCIYTASNLLERNLLGLIIYKIFRDPFQNPNLTELPIDKQVERFGVSTVVSLAIGHMTWLIQKLKDNSFSGVLFLARDGWLSYNIYNHIRKTLSLPLATYYYANRHAAFLCCADSVQEIERMVDLAKERGLNKSELLKNVLQIQEKDVLPYDENDTVLDYIEKHMDCIQKKVNESRNGYLRYSEKCGILPDHHYAVVDGFSVGNTQSFLAKMVPFHMKGFYFGCYIENLQKKEIEYYLQSENRLLLHRFIELETFFTSSEPSQNCMSEQGNPVFAEEHRCLPELNEVNTVLNLAEEFAKEYFSLFYMCGQVVSPKLIEEIYAAEDYYNAKHIIYDDWLGVPVKKREEEKKD